MPASRYGFKTKLQCSTPRRRRRRPTDLTTGSMFATRDYGVLDLHISAFTSAILRPTDHPDSGRSIHIEGFRRFEELLRSPVSTFVNRGPDDLCASVLRPHYLRT